MIIFNKAKYARRLINEKLLPNESCVKLKLSIITEYLLQKNLSNTDIMEQLVSVSEPFFAGMSKEYIQKYIQSIIKKIRTHIDNATDYTFDNGNDTPLNIYYRELQEIESLNNDKLERVAFAFLVYYKWCDTEFALKNKGSGNNPNVYIEKNSEVFELAHITNKNTSGNRKAKILHTLTMKGLYRFCSKPRSDYMFSHKEIVANLFCVPVAHEYIEKQIKYYQEQQALLQKSTEDETTKFNKADEIKCKLDLLAQQTDNDKVAFEITNFDNIILYYRRYKNDPNIINCSMCGCLIEKTNNRKKYCTDCASEKKRNQNLQYSQMAG